MKFSIYPALLVASMVAYPSLLSATDTTFKGSNPTDTDVTFGAHWDDSGSSSCYSQTFIIPANTTSTKTLGTDGSSPCSKEYVEWFVTWGTGKNDRANGVIYGGGGDITCLEAGYDDAWSGSVCGTD